jgi:predicted branched-subunit amino acid permease
MLSRLWDNIRFFLGLAIVCWMVWVITTANAYGLSVLHIEVQIY